MVGVIDKVGLLPLAITAYFAYRKILSDHHKVLMVGSVDWTWALLVFVVTMYLGAIHYTSVNQQLDSLGLVLKHAVQRKKALPSAAQTNGVGKEGAC
jgi:p-aminobenzoyl-glutamate transporter AbgT